jgi:antitoxin VapB
MPPVAKVFMTGNSQAIRLPKAFRVGVAEMWITKNNISGEITLRPKDDNLRKRNLEKLFRMIAENPLPKDFLSEASRLNDPPTNPFDGAAARVRSRK